MSTLRHDLRDLVADQPGVPDWPGLVRADVRRRQRRLLSATAAVVLLLTGGGFALAGQDGRATVVPAATPSPTPTADEQNPVVVFLDPEVTRVPADVPVDLVVVSRGYLDGPPLILQLQVDGQQEAPDIAASCALVHTEGAPPPERQHTEVRQTVARTFTPGPHVVVVRAGSLCSYYAGAASASYTITAVQGEEPPASEVEVLLDPEAQEGPADTPFTFTVVARAVGDDDVAVLELLVDGVAELPEPQVQCAAPGQPSPRLRREARRTFTRTLAPGRHHITVRAGGACSGQPAARHYAVLAYSLP